jgi:hypothetical protein
MFSEVKAFEMKSSLTNTSEGNVSNFVWPDYLQIFHFTNWLADAEGQVRLHYSIVSEWTAFKFQGFSQEEKWI